MIPNRFVLLDRERGFVDCTLTERVIGNADKVISQMASQIPVTLARVGESSGIMLSIISKQDSLLVFGYVPGIVLKCDWHTSQGDRRMWPNWGGGNTFSITWPVPITMRLVFAVSITLLGDHYDIDRHTGAHLAAVSTRYPGWFRLPLSNLFPDARICLGSDGCSSSTAIGAFGEAWSRFCNARFSSDLQPSGSDMGKAKHLFSFSTDGGAANAVPPDNWEDDCTLVNSSVLGSINL